MWWVSSSAMVLLLVLLGEDPVWGGFTSDLRLSRPAEPYGVVVDPVSRTLFVSDMSLNRVVRFGNVSKLTMGSGPVRAFGQPDLTPNTVRPPTTQTSLYGPRGIWVDSSGTLWVSDTLNNRILWWFNAATLPNGSPANGVIGQDSFTTSDSGVAQNRLSRPEALMIQLRALWVVDTASHRVLRFDDAGMTGFPTKGAYANGVIGQSSFESSGAASPPTATSLFFPLMVFKAFQSDLLVADVSNRRVLHYKKDDSRLPNAPASYAHGQQSLMQQVSYTPRARTLRSPAGLAVGYDYTVFVSDRDNNRILLFPPLPATANFMSAVTVIGQPAFNTSLAGIGDDQLDGPRGIFYDAESNSLWVADSRNRRILRFGNVLVKPVANISNVDVTFLTNTPQVKIYPKDSAGQTDPIEKVLYLQPFLIEELDSNGTARASLSFPDYGYNITSYSIPGISQTFEFLLVSPPKQVLITYTIFETAQSINSSGVSFTTNSSSVKFEIFISGWNFTLPGRSLRLHLLLNIKPNVTDIKQQDYNDTTTFTLQSSNVLTSIINLIRFCTIENSTNLPISFRLGPAPPDYPSALDLVVDLPFFNSSVRYDPDFLLILSPEAAASGDGGSDDETLLPLIAIAAIVVIPSVFLLLGLVVVLWVWYKRRKMRAAIVSALQKEL